MEQGLKVFGKIILKLPKIALDTSCLLYYIEQNPKYEKFTQIIFEELLLSGNTKAIASTLIITETLPPAFAENRRDLVLAYKSAILGLPNLTIYPVTEQIAETAAYIRGVHRLSTPDAIHLATAIEEGAKAIIGNDKKWKKVKEIKTIVLEDFI